MAKIKKLLIANRGEIARRIMRTCRQQGIATVAVYSEPDATLPHVMEADQAVCLGPAAARESYLVIDKVIAAARATGADAIHPGYGFLSENTAFAAACDQAGIVFVGPNARAIDIMGDKAAARQLMAESGVPVLPGFDKEGASDSELIAAATEVGFPLLIKAVAGGGGKGMRVVNSAGEFDEALAAARREASNAFGDDRVLLERYLATAATWKCRCLLITTATLFTCSNETVPCSVATRKSSKKRRHRASTTPPAMPSGKPRYKPQKPSITGARERSNFSTAMTANSTSWK